MKEILHKKISELVENDPGNRDENGTRYFEAPLIGFASGSDELFARYKSIIGPFHWTPAEVLEQAFGGVAESGKRSSEKFEGTVICWILPITRNVRLSNRKETTFPSRLWGRTRNFGEHFNNTVRQTVMDFLSGRGFKAAAPMLLEEWGHVPDYRNRIASRWSERHAAYAAGLGTFSINDGMITERGIAHRIGTVVTDLVLRPDQKPYSDYRENCLLCRGQKCGKCIDRCPVNAISANGHDKELCRAHCDESSRIKGKEYGVTITGCGLCQTKVPCEASIPRFTE